MLFEELLESSPDAIIVTDLEGRITGANAQLEKLFGFSRSELLGQPVEALIPERFRSAHPAHRKTFHTEPRMRPMGVGVELYARRKDGSEFPVDIMLSPVETTEGRAVLSVIHDITEKKRAEETLRKSEEQWLTPAYGRRTVLVQRAARPSRPATASKPLPPLLSSGSYAPLLD
jgi:protein-histidine pros-kinase